MGRGRRAAAAREWDREQDFTAVPVEQWEVLRDRMQQRHDEAMEDRRRIEDGAHRTAVFASGLATAAFGLSHIGEGPTTWFVAAATGMFGAAAAVALLSAGTVALPAMHRLQTLTDDATNAPERFAEFEARDLNISSEEIRDAMEPVTWWIRVSRWLVVLGVFCLLAEVIAISARPCEDQTTAVPSASEAAPETEPQA